MPSKMSRVEKALWMTLQSITLYTALINAEGMARQIKRYDDNNRHTLTISLSGDVVSRETRRAG